MIVARSLCRVLLHQRREVRGNLRLSRDKPFATLGSRPLAYSIAGPFFFDDYGSNCWQSERIHTPAGWRWHRVWACY
jgi:hypothetical protein